MDAVEIEVDAMLAKVEAAKGDREAARTAVREVLDKRQGRTPVTAKPPARTARSAQAAAEAARAAARQQGLEARRDSQPESGSA